MRIFKIKSFARFCRKADIDDSRLNIAFREIESGLIEADLGGYVFKQRVARKGEGKSGGFRTILLMRKGERILFVRGFAKRDMDNITDMELAAYQSLAVRALGANEAIVAELLTGGEWIEVNTDA